MTVMEDAGRGWRRVVASPSPKPSWRSSPSGTWWTPARWSWPAAAAASPSITGGHHLKGAGAVIDKDFASELLAQQLDADTLIILTAVEKVAINFGKPDQKWLDHLTPEEARHIRGGGPVRPRLHAAQGQAAVKFAESKPGRTALITLLEKAKDGIAGKPAPPSPCKIQKGQSVILYKESEKTSPCLSFSPHYCAYRQGRPF